MGDGGRVFEAVPKEAPDEGTPLDALNISRSDFKPRASSRGGLDRGSVIESTDE